MIAYDASADKIKHYRVDKMRNIELLDEKLQGKELFQKFDMASYSKMNFGMFGGEAVKVKVRFKNELVGVFIDRFGKDISVRRTDDPDWVEANVDVAMSDQFLGWIFSLGPGVKIVAPQEAVDRYIREIEAIRAMY
jgi:predicted DNA-binding transcriptional regulator YafY